MKKLTGLWFLFIFTNCTAQYYYKDLVAAADIRRVMKTYKDNQVTKVTATGITPDGTATTDFGEVHNISPDNRILKVTTRVSQTTSALLYRFDEQGRLISIKDSSAGIVSSSLYSYDSSGRIVLISNTIADSDTASYFSQTETHQYVYENGRAKKMWRIINRTDSLEVRFETDENGNIVEERNFKKGNSTDPLYYYYDDKNRLTDIVRYNYKVQRLLPDFLFEYDDSNRVIQKITTTSNQNMGYLIWRYLYNEKGLKTKEALFDKEKKMQGRIDYSYN